MTSCAPSSVSQDYAPFLGFPELGDMAYDAVLHNLAVIAVGSPSTPKRGSRTDTGGSLGSVPRTLSRSRAEVPSARIG